MNPSEPENNADVKVEMIAEGDQNHGDKLSPETAPKKRSFTMKEIGILAAVAVVLLIIIYVIFDYLTDRAFKQYMIEKNKEYKELYKTNPFDVFITMAGVFFFIHFFCFPSRNWAFLFMLITTDDMFVCCAFFIVMELLSCTAAYFFGKYVVRSWFKRKTEGRWLFDFISRRAEKTPWKFAIVIRLFVLPDGFKSYTMALFDIPYKVHIAVAAVNYVVAAFVISFMHDVDNIQELVDRGSKFGQFEIYEDMLEMSGYALLISIIGALGYGIYFIVNTVQKVAKSDEEDKKPEQNP